MTEGAPKIHPTPEKKETYPELESSGQNKPQLKEIPKKGKAEGGLEPKTEKTKRTRFYVVENGEEKAKNLTDEQLQELLSDGYQETTNDKKKRVLKKPYDYENELIFDPREDRDKILNIEEKRQAIQEGYEIKRVDERKRELVRKKTSEAIEKRENKPQEERVQEDSQKERLWPAPLGIKMGDFLVNKKGDRIAVMDIISIDPADPEYKKYGAGYMTLEYPDGQEENVPFSKIYEKRKSIQIEKPTGELKTSKEENGEYQTKETTVKLKQKTTQENETVRAEIVLEDAKNYIEQTIKKDIEVLDKYLEDKKDKLEMDQNKELSDLLKEYADMHHNFVTLIEMYLNNSTGKTIDAAHAIQNLTKEFKTKKKEVAEKIKSIKQAQFESKMPKIENYSPENRPNSTEEQKQEKETMLSRYRKTLGKIFKKKPKNQNP